MAEISLSQGPPVISGKCSKKHSKCIYCDLERAVAHTSMNSSSEMNCTTNFIVPLLIKTDMVSFRETVWCQCKMEILLIGKFIRINTCREGKSGTKFSWCFEGRGLVWALGGVVLLFGGGCLLFVHLWLGIFLVYGLAHVEVVLILSVFAGAIILPKNKLFILQET